MLGGYQTISLNGVDLSNAVDDTIDGLYRKITESNKKAVLVGDFKINGIVKNSVFVPVQTQGNAITMNLYGKRITIHDDDLITITDAPTDGILIFDSVDEMNAASAPDGTIALVPSEGDSGGGLPVVELSLETVEELVNAAGVNVVLPQNAYDSLTYAKTNQLPVIVKVPGSSLFAPLVSGEYMTTMDDATLKFIESYTEVGGVSSHSWLGGIVVE